MAVVTRGAKRLLITPGFLGLIVAVMIAAMAALAATPCRAGQRPDARELERARREVRLLDDIYKTAIVLVTTHYVDEASDMPAGEAFKALFAQMKAKGWHEVRLIDGAGEPINEDNLPRDAFERAAIEAFLAGKPYYEEVAEHDGKSTLRAATPIPLVMEKCVMCHENYRGKKLVGALGYSLPLSTE